MKSEFQGEEVEAEPSELLEVATRIAESLAREVKPPAVNVEVKAPIIHVPASRPADVKIHEAPRPKGASGQLRRADGSVTHFEIQFTY